MENRTRSHPDAAQSREATLALLSDQRRRSVGSLLSERDSPIALRQLAAAVASREGGADTGEVSPETADAIATTLHHVHLPKLAAAGVIDYDAEANTVTSTRTQGLPLAETAEDGDEPRSP